MSQVYTPGKGFAQASYYDQIATALPGALAFASDTRLVDTFIVDPEVPATGLIAGIGVVAEDIPAAARAGARLGVNAKYAKLPAAGTTAAKFAGVLVRNQQMSSNSDGDACWFANAACNVLRSERVGGRIWVRMVQGTSTAGGSVHWIISDTSSHGFPIGSFAAEAIGSDTIELTNAVFCDAFTGAKENGSALIEIGRTA